MSSQVFILLFTYFFLFILCLSQKTAVNTRANSGPFTAIPIRKRNCEKPTIPYVKDKEPMVDLYMDMKNTIITGNITVHKALANSKASMQDLFYEDGRWQVIFQMKRLDCRTSSSMVSLLAKAFGVVYDKKTCAIGKGTYNFVVDYNTIEHIWTSTREYGRMIRRLEWYIKAGTFACYELESEVRPKTT